MQVEDMMLPGPRQKGSLPRMCSSLASLTGNKDGSEVRIVLRVKRTPTRFPTNSLYTPMGNILKGCQDSHAISYCLM